MRKLLPVLLLVAFQTNLHAKGKDSTYSYSLPDSVRASSFIADINISSVPIKKEVFAGIKTDAVSLLLESEKNEKQVTFEFPKTAMAVASGISIDKSRKGKLEWNYNWELNQTYKLLISVVTDSAENFSIYAGYIWLAQEKKWKLIGSCKINGQWTMIKSPSSFFSSGKKKSINATINNAWCQRSNGTWRKLDENQQAIPLINLVGHVDSLQQFQLEKETIEKAIASGQTDVKENIENVYYKISDPGSGRQVAVTDTVTVHYKGYLFSNGEVFDQTKETPATFPLNRLIKAWQVAIPLVKVGGKIKLVIPSALAYSIRTRAAKIPPNSILVFEIEVLDAKPAVVH